MPDIQIDNYVPDGTENCAGAPVACSQLSAMCSCLGIPTPSPTYTVTATNTLTAVNTQLVSETSYVCIQIVHCIAVADDLGPNHRHHHPDCH